MSGEESILDQIDRQRTAQGFRSIGELMGLADSGNTVLDPFSVLISSSVTLGKNNFFYPNVIIRAIDESDLSLGNGNVFYPSTFILADEGRVMIGDSNQFGDGGCAIKANMPDAAITIGDNGRYINGAQILGKTVLGSGSQVLGPITVQNCTLEAGTDYRSKDPDQRAGLLKGSGLARDINVPVGYVVNGDGQFAQDDLESQASYHPKS